TARVAEGLAGEELKVVDGLRDVRVLVRPVLAGLIDLTGCGRKLPPAQPVGRPQQDRHTLFGGSARPGGKRLLRRRDRRADLLGRRLLADGHDLVFLRGVVGVEFVFRSDTLAADDQGELFADLCGDRAQRLLHRRAARIGRKIGEWFVAKLRKRHKPPPGLAACALRWISTSQYTTHPIHHKVLDLLRSLGTWRKNERGDHSDRRAADTRACCKPTSSSSSSFSWPSPPPPLVAAFRILHPRRGHLLRQRSAMMARGGDRDREVPVEQGNAGPAQ